MATDSLTNAVGNVRALRNIWSSIVQEQEKQSKPTLGPSPLPSKQQEQNNVSKDITPLSQTADETTIVITSAKKELPTVSFDQNPTFQYVEKLSPIKEDRPVLFAIPSPPTSSAFRTQLQSSSKNNTRQTAKLTSTHHWHVTRDVFRSGLALSRTRRASDSILPLLIRTHEANHRLRTDSIDSTFSQAPFENLIDYLNSNRIDNNSLLGLGKAIRSASFSYDCIRRNRLDDSIAQYEIILRHLKNHAQFILNYPIASSQKYKSLDIRSSGDIIKNYKNTHAKLSPPKQRTQSLSRKLPDTFSRFIMNDPLLAVSTEQASDEQHCSNPSQTDISQPIHNAIDPPNYSAFMTSSADVKEILDELDTILDNNHEDVPITANTEINVIVLNLSNEPSEAEKTPSEESSLIQRLFEGKKTAYSFDDSNIQSTRLPEELIPTYEIAKVRCFFDTEELIYTTRMIKLNRRGYSQHVRLLCLTSQRLYNIRKKNPYPKEVLLLNQIIGITCTPYKDGFVCIHTQESHEDRGDWLILVDHPCELITQLFLVMQRDDNNDGFLKIESKFTNCRRFCGESSSCDCSIEARLADTFRIKKVQSDTLIIFTP